MFIEFNMQTTNKVYNAGLLPRCLDYRETHIETHKINFMVESMCGEFVG